MQVNALMRVSLSSPGVQVYLINSSMLTGLGFLYFSYKIFCLFDFFNKLDSIFRSKY